MSKIVQTYFDEYDCTETTHTHTHTHTQTHTAYEILGEKLTLKNIYSRLSLSRTRLSRITAYLEVKIWSLF